MRLQVFPSGAEELIVIGCYRNLGPASTPKPRKE